MNALSTIMRKNVYNVSYNQESAEEVKSMMEEILQNVVDSSKVNNNNEMLLSYGIKVVCLDGKYSIDEAKSMVIDDDYTWGKVGKNR